MSNRRLQFAPDSIDYAAISRQAELRVNRITLNIIVVSIIIAVAIIPAQLADWIA
jgi:hypothetical protein